MFELTSFADARQNNTSLSMNSFKGRPTRTPRLPFLTRLSLASLLLISCILLLTHLHPSPWLSPSLPLFLRPPPPLSILSGTTPPVSGCQNLFLTTLEPRETAAIVLLLREQDLAELLPTLDNFESKFNANFRYPYVFLSSPDAPTFSHAFRSAVEEALPLGAVTEWGEVPIEHWSIPAWMDEEEVRRGFAQQEKDGVQYAGREAYHHMCRFYSGFWAQHPLLAKYDWYWRLEPGGTSSPSSSSGRADARSSAVLLLDHVRSLPLPLAPQQSLRLRHHHRRNAQHDPDPVRHGDGVRCEGGDHARPCPVGVPDEERGRREGGVFVGALLDQL